LPPAHQQGHHAHGERIVRHSRNQKIAIYTQSTDDVRDRLRARGRRKNHSRAAELLQFSHCIDGGRIDVMMRAEFFRERFFVFATSECNCFEPHFASVLHSKMSEAPNALYRDDVTGTRAGVPQGVKDCHACAHEWSGFFRW
jgi:hypothetical protein